MFYDDNIRVIKVKRKKYEASTQEKLSTNVVRNLMSKAIKIKKKRNSKFKLQKNFKL